MEELRIKDLIRVADGIDQVGSKIMWFRLDRAKPLGLVFGAYTISVSEKTALSEREKTLLAEMLKDKNTPITYNQGS